LLEERVRRSVRRGEKDDAPHPRAEVEFAGILDRIDRGQDVSV